MPTEPPLPAWSPGPFWNPARRRRVATYLVAYALAHFLWRWWRAIVSPMGDFMLHWKFGHRFLNGEFLYEGGMHTPYPPFWATASSLLNIGPVEVVRAVLYPLGLVPLALLLVPLVRRLRRSRPLDREPALWAVALALVLSSRFLIRELPECGANLWILALTWGGVFAWTRRLDMLGGVSLGLAIALKCTPALFVVYFAWKRQWRIAASSMAAALAFALAPVLWMGAESFTLHMGHWLGNVQHGLSEPHPLRGVLGDEKLGNLSLRPALGRLLVRMDDAPEANLTEIGHVQLLDLPPAIGGLFVKAVMLGLLLLVAREVGRGMGRRDDPVVLWEAAAVSLLMLLYSPITWRQHCVAAVPAMLLLAWEWVAAGPSPRAWVRRSLGFYTVAVLLLDRGLVGRTGTLLLDSYGLTTWALLAVLGVTLEGRRQAAVRGIAGLELQSWRKDEAHGIGDEAGKPHRTRAGSRAEGTVG